MTQRQEKIQERLDNLEDEDQLIFCVQTVVKGIMKFPWYVRMFKPFVKWRLKINDMQAWVVIFMILNKSNPNMIDNFIEDFCGHMYDGIDKTGLSLSGGFNDAELLEIEMILDFVEKNAKSTV